MAADVGRPVRSSEEIVEVGREGLLSESGELRMPKSD